jgi:hypothetical protein
MAQARARIELILRDRFEDAGVEPPKVGAATVVDLADRLRDESGAHWLTSPEDLAAALGISVRDGEPPDDIDVVTLPGRIIVRAGLDERERGLMVLCGIARLWLADVFGRHSSSDVVLLAAEIAAPAGFVLRRGVAPLLERQRHLPAWFLRACERSIVGPPSSQIVGR